jgi:hypothetical protein
MLDIKITQGEYWGGAQINYWVYVFLAIFPLTGIFGFDHMALRSPMTAIMKFLSIIPLLGFWYFYDIAQLLGERDLVEKNGLAVPFYGPIGLGAGMFSGTEGIKVAPKDAPSPWLYLAYALTTCIFIAFPINKFVIGDYMGGISQLLMYICIFTIVTPFLAIAWGFYDIYKVLFKTRDIIEEGPERFIPATWFMDDKFNRRVLGPLPTIPSKPADTWFKRLVEAWVEAPISAAKIVTKTEDSFSNVVESTGNSISKVAGSAGVATDIIETGARGVTEAVTNAAVKPIKNATKVATNTIEAAGEISNTLTGTIEDGAGAVKDGMALLAKLPQIGEKVAGELSDPQKLIEAAKNSPNSGDPGKLLKGGALLTGAPAVSSAVLIFGVGLVAFTGFVFYYMRKTYKKPEKSDDPPRDSAAI